VRSSRERFWIIFVRWVDQFYEQHESSLEARGAIRVTSDAMSTFSRSFTPILLTLTSFAVNGTQSEPTSLTLIDPTRNRSIPIALYRPVDGTKPFPLVLISPAYGGTNTAYGFIADALTKKGYVVASIQHDLRTDPPLPTSGKIYESRLPIWKMGEANILFVIQELVRQGVATKGRQVVLIGHSHGGDITMLTVRDHPDQVVAAVSLDNRRFPFPRTRSPRICSIRSTDQVADPGVLPSATEAKQFGMRIVQARDLKHNDMWDEATAPQKAQILEVVLGCL
jgi:pimeloyl-ACP methyl ester carboxylesterase